MCSGKQIYASMPLPRGDVPHRKILLRLIPPPVKIFDLLSFDVNGLYIVGFQPQLWS